MGWGRGGGRTRAPPVQHPFAACPNTWCVLPFRTAHRYRATNPPFCAATQSQSSPNLPLHLYFLQHIYCTCQLGGVRSNEGVKIGGSANNTGRQDHHIVWIGIEKRRVISQSPKEGVQSNTGRQDHHIVTHSVDRVLRRGG